MSDIPDREPIASGRDDEQIAEVMAGHDHNSAEPVAPFRYFKADRRVVIAISVAVACFSAAVLVAILAQYRTAANQRTTITAQVGVISEQGHTIDVERSRSAQIERQAADLQSQVNDQQNQTLCRAQIANDYESLRTTLDLLVSHRDQVFREALSVALQGDREGFVAKLSETATLDPQIADLEPKVQAAAQARQESVATCQKAATKPAPATPGG